MAMTFDAAPRLELGTWPTPLDPSPELDGVLGCRGLWIKRDDLTGFSWGGNKVRAVEFLLGDALARGSTEVVLAGGPSSNFAAVMADAATVAGLGVQQVCYGDEPARPVAALLAGRAAGAEVHFTGSSDRASMEDVAADLAVSRAAGGEVPYVVPRGGASAVGALGFAAAARELDRQAERTPGVPSTIVIPLGSGGSVAGLLAGLAASPRGWTVHAVSVSREPADVQPKVVETAVRCAALLGSSLDPADVGERLHVHDGRAPGFGCLSDVQERVAIEVARCSGLHLDPTYNAKTMWWLRQASIAAVRDAPVLYWYTGGALGAFDLLFARRGANRG